MPTRLRNSISIDSTLANDDRPMTVGTVAATEFLEQPQQRRLLQALHRYRDKLSHSGTGFDEAQRHAITLADRGAPRALFVAVRTPQYRRQLPHAVGVVTGD